MLSDPRTPSLKIDWIVEEVEVAGVAGPVETVETVEAVEHTPVESEHCRKGRPYSVHLSHYPSSYTITTVLSRRL